MQVNLKKILKNNLSWLEVIANNFNNMRINTQLITWYVQNMHLI